MKFYQASSVDRFFGPLKEYMLLLLNHDQVLPLAKIITRAIPSLRSSRLSSSAVNSVWPFSCRTIVWV